MLGFARWIPNLPAEIFPSRVEQNIFLFYQSGVMARPFFPAHPSNTLNPNVNLSIEHRRYTFYIAFRRGSKLRGIDHNFCFILWKAGGINNAHTHTLWHICEKFMSAIFVALGADTDPLIQFSYLRRLWATDV